MLIAGDVVMAFTGIRKHVDFANKFWTVSELVAMNIFEDTLVINNTDYYDQKCKHLSK